MLVADARMLPSVDFFNRWRHHKAVTARMYATLHSARQRFVTSRLKVAMRTMKNVYISEVLATVEEGGASTMHC